MEWRFQTFPARIAGGNSLARIATEPDGGTCGSLRPKPEELSDDSPADGLVFSPLFALNFRHDPPRRMVIITDGHNDAHTAKTAICLIRYRPDEVVAVLDRQSAGKTCQKVFGVGGQIPVVGSLAEAPEANTFLVGIAPPGGKIPPLWRPIILEAIARKLTIVSGLHDFLCDDAEFRQAADRHGVELVDVRRNDEHDVANRQGIREGCLRIHTIGNDCSIGKMVVSVEVAAGLSRAGIDAAFVATGQTGILVAGGGCPVDRVISDFVSGAAEKLVLANQHHDTIVVEGPGQPFPSALFMRHARPVARTHARRADALLRDGTAAFFGMEDIRLAVAREGGRVLRVGGQHHAPVPSDRRGSQWAAVRRRRGGGGMRPRESPAGPARVRRPSPRPGSVGRGRAAAACDAECRCLLRDDLQVGHENH